MYLNLEIIEKVKNPHTECQLVVAADDRIVTQKIDSGIFIELRRWIRDKLTISTTHPNTQIYFKSASARRREESRHLSSYYYIIHPFSTFSLCWETFMFFIYIYMLVVYSFDDVFMFTVEYRDTIGIVKFAGDTVYAADIFHFFWEGYYDSYTSKTVLNPWKIIKTYLLGYFIIDFIAIIPSILIPVAWLGYINQSENSVFMWLRFLGIVRLIRIGRWLETLELINRYKNYSTYIYKTMKVILVYAIILCCLYFFIFFIRLSIRKYQNKPIDSIQDRYLTATLILMLAAGGAKRMPSNFLVICWTVTFLCAAFVLQMYLFAQLLQAWNTFIYAKTTTSNIVQQFRQYMKYKGLPIELRKKIITFFDFKFQQDFYHEKRMNYLISEVLRNRMLLELVRNRLVDSHIFKQLPSMVLYRLVVKMTSEIYLEDDIIIRAGTVNEYMYFIYNGTVAVYDSNGFEVCHLEDGASFGEMCLLLNYRKIVSVVAVTPSEIFKLSKRDFFAILKDYPDIRERVLQDSRKRFCNTRTGYF